MKKVWVVYSTWEVGCSLFMVERVNIEYVCNSKEAANSTAADFLDIYLHCECATVIEEMV